MFNHFDRCDHSESTIAQSSSKIGLIEVDFYVRDPCFEVVRAPVRSNDITTHTFQACSHGPRSRSQIGRLHARAHPVCQHTFTNEFVKATICCCVKHYFTVLVLLACKSEHALLSYVPIQKNLVPSGAPLRPICGRTLGRPATARAVPPDPQRLLS